MQYIIPQAARLLRSSILKIEQSDIELEDMAPIADPHRAEEDAEGDAVMADAQQQQQQQQQGGAVEEGDAVMADAEGAAPEEAAEATAAPPAVKEPTQITAQKFNYIRSMLAKKLTEVQQEQVKRDT